MNRLARLGWLAFALAACRGSGDREQEADREYVAGRYGAAYERYDDLARQSGSARQWAKAAAAAAHAGLLDSAIPAYQRVAAADSSRRQEAADGVLDVGRRAVRTGNLGATRRAISALSSLAPGRPLGSFALAMLADSAEASLNDIVQLTPSAIAAAYDAQEEDRLLLQYADAMVQRQSCDEAARAFAAVMRRGSEPAMRDSAASGFANCSLQLGLAAPSAIVADRWLSRAAGARPGSLVSRRALLALGTARLRQGDQIAAAIAWQQAAGAADDSIAVAAREQLRLLTPPEPDSTENLAPAESDAPADGM